jgi:solute carrier family 34 (sodium-dependent phosphate cotransporter)
MVNFGKTYITEIIPEWENYYLNYKKLKEISNREKIAENTDLIIFFKNFDENINNEINKVNDFYINEINNISNNTPTDMTVDTIKNLLERCDKLRNFIILNIISIIKIVKRRNKRTHIVNNVLNFIKNREFYQCELLSEVYSNIYHNIKNKKIEYVDSFINNNSMIFTLSTLKNIKNNTNFSDYNLLPHYNNINENFNFSDYLTNKLGPNNMINKIISIPNNKISIDEFINKNNASDTQNNDNDNDNTTNMLFTHRLYYFFIVTLLLYLFLIGLDLMSNSFKILSGKGMYSLFSSIKNPIAGVMIGIIATVLLQSSSTTTSIIVTMVGSNLLTVEQAIPMIMGANIGTSITNTLVSHAHINNVNEFKLAFAGATVHDMFNFLSLIILLPVETISEGLKYPLLFKISKKFTGIFVNVESVSFNSPLKVILKPIVKQFCVVDKNVIKGISNGCINCNSTISSTCWDLKMKNCMTREDWDATYPNGNIIKSGFLKGLGNDGGGAVGLFISLVILCFALYFIVKILHKLVVSNNGKGKMLNMIKKTLEISPYLTMFVGMLLTISVQSSSIITSTFTPLVGLSILTVEQMFPLTLGANIGTTCTAILASIVTESPDAIQIALCHFIFNIVGTVILFPIPVVRKIPIKMAGRLGVLVSKFKWFGIFYILYTFLLFPATAFSISFLISLNTIGLVIGIILLISFCVLSLLLFYKFEIIFQWIKFNYTKCRHYDEIQQNNVELAVI